MLITGLPAYLQDSRNELLGLSPLVTGWQDPREGAKSEQKSNPNVSAR